MKKISLILCAVLFAAAALSFTVSASGTCEFIGIDRDTHGNWVGVYGEDGYIIYADVPNDKTPAYASFEHITDEGVESPFYTWSEAVMFDSDLTEAERATEPALYYDETKQERGLSCYYNNAGDRIHYLNIDIGAETKYITIYSCDYNDNERAANITVRDDAGNILAETIHLDNYQTGAYLRFKVSGKISIEYADDTPDINAVYSAVFFDNIEPEPEPEPEIVLVDEPADAAPVEATAVEPAAAAAPPATPAPLTSDNNTAVILLVAAGIFILRAVNKNRVRSQKI